MAALTFLWRIENFSYWDIEYHGEKITCPVVRDFHTLEVESYLHLFPKGREERDKHLRVLFETSCSDIADCELSFLDGNGSALATWIVRNPEFERNTPLDLQCLPTQEEVFKSKRSSFLPHDTLTVRCRLTGYSMNPAPSLQISYRSRIEVRGASVQLDVGLLKTLRPYPEKKYHVSFNETAEDKELECIYFLMGEHINFKIFRKDNDEPLFLTCKLCILNTDKKKIKCFQDRHAFNRSSYTQTWYFPHFLSRKEILENHDIDSISITIIASLSNISGTVESFFAGYAGQQCDFPNDVFSPTSEASTQTMEQICDQLDISQKRNDSGTILREDLLSMYKDQTLFDFELRSGDVSFPVHKNVLSARSPVFRAMFCGDLQEATSTSQDVPDVDAHTLNRMLTFLYSGTVDDLQWEGAAKLYYAADKYQVQYLKEECSDILRSRVSVSNVSDILELADRHQDQVLTSFVHDFLLIHYDEVVLSDEWDKFLERSGSFGGKTMKEIYKKKLEK